MENTARLRFSGHLLDSLTLSKILETVQAVGAVHRIERMEVGSCNACPSELLLQVQAPSLAILESLLVQLVQLGAEILDNKDGVGLPAPAAGVFPEGFYVTTNLPTWVRIQGDWVKVEDQVMDGAVQLGPVGPVCVKMSQVKKGDVILVGDQGIRLKTDPPKTPSEDFAFMTSEVSSEKPVAAQIGLLAAQMKAMRAEGKKILWVAGPALIHVGGRELFVRLIKAGWVDQFFSGNALATHDLEADLFGTSLGVGLADGQRRTQGNRNHLYTINRIRGLGGIEQAVEQGVIQSGIMKALVDCQVDFLLAGSIRDDGPLPEVITDTAQALKQMRSKLTGVGLAVLVSTLLHSIATGNLLSAETITWAVDISPAAAIKLKDRGSHQSNALVMDVHSFLHQLVAALEA